MSSISRSSGSSSQKLLQRLGLQPAEAWLLILGFIFVTALLAMVGAGKILNFAFPAGAFVVGLFLYLRFPVLYVGFIWWLFFLTPFVRRYADYRNTFTDPSPIILAPYLAVIVVLPALLKELPKIYRKRSLGLSFILPCVAIFYAACTAKVQNIPTATIIISTLDWLIPLLFGFYVFTNWHLYPKFRQNFQRTFLWGILVTSIYGIYQFVVAPEWDRLWRIETNFVSVGLPEPFEFHIFSTMNSNGPFAITLMTGLLLLFNSQTSLRFPAAGVGLVAILLSNVRTSWGALLLGILTYAASLKLKYQMRLFVTLLVLGTVVIPVINMEPFAAKVTDRVDTFSNIEEDRSGQERLALYQRVGYESLMSVAGQGIGSRQQDSGFITMLFQLGWVGTIPYLIGMLQLMLNLFNPSKNINDSFTYLTRAIVLPIFVTLLMGPTMIEVSGVILWGFLGLGAASSQYHQQFNRLKGAQIR